MSLTELERAVDALPSEELTKLVTYIAQRTNLAGTRRWKTILLRVEITQGRLRRSTPKSSQEISRSFRDCTRAESFRKFNSQLPARVQKIPDKNSWYSRTIRDIPLSASLRRIKSTPSKSVAVIVPWLARKKRPLLLVLDRHTLRNTINSGSRFATFGAPTN
jgi:hypothetical protein